ncbi:uncharacterized protein LOC128219541 [Mya arenaria]|uniref:uncharacterized protein LOC128219541 n=1 Tax=Mya arenaria TaxID=6604 RepID=UPI0022E28F73|nr:uncharacterized protein LOC128219541 [Mya arenaria]
MEEVGFKEENDMKTKEIEAQVEQTVEVDPASGKQEVTVACLESKNVLISSSVHVQQVERVSETKVKTEHMYSETVTVTVGNGTESDAYASRLQSLQEKTEVSDDNAAEFNSGPEESRHEGEEVDEDTEEHKLVKKEVNVEDVRTVSSSYIVSTYRHMSKDFDIETSLDNLEYAVAGHNDDECFTEKQIQTVACEATSLDLPPEYTETSSETADYKTRSDSDCKRFAKKQESWIIDSYKTSWQIEEHQNSLEFQNFDFINVQLVPKTSTQNEERIKEKQEQTADNQQKEEPISDSKKKVHEKLISEEYKTNWTTEDVEIGQNNTQSDAIETLPKEETLISFALGTIWKTGENTSKIVDDKSKGTKISSCGGIDDEKKVVVETAEEGKKTAELSDDKTQVDDRQVTQNIVENRKLMSNSDSKRITMKQEKLIIDSYKANWKTSENNQNDVEQKKAVLVLTDPCVKPDKIISDAYRTHWEEQEKEVENNEDMKEEDEVVASFDKIIMLSPRSEKLIKKPINTGVDVCYSGNLQAEDLYETSPSFSSGDETSSDEENSIKEQNNKLEDMFEMKEEDEVVTSFDKIIMLSPRSEEPIKKPINIGVDVSYSGNLKAEDLYETSPSFSSGDETSSDEENSIKVQDNKLEDMFEMEIAKAVTIDSVGNERESTVDTVKNDSFVDSNEATDITEVQEKEQSPTKYSTICVDNIIEKRVDFVIEKTDTMKQETTQGKYKASYRDSDILETNLDEVEDHENTKDLLDSSLGTSSDDTSEQDSEDEMNESDLEDMFEKNIGESKIELSGEQNLLEQLDGCDEFFPNKPDLKESSSKKAVYLKKSGECFSSTSSSEDEVIISTKQEANALSSSYAKEQEVKSKEKYRKRDTDLMNNNYTEEEMEKSKAVDGKFTEPKLLVKRVESVRLKKYNGDVGISKQTMTDDQEKNVTHSSKSVIVKSTVFEHSVMVVGNTEAEVKDKGKENLEGEFSVQEDLNKFEQINFERELDADMNKTVIKQEPEERKGKFVKIREAHVYKGETDVDFNVVNTKYRVDIESKEEKADSSNGYDENQNFNENKQDHVYENIDSFREKNKDTVRETNETSKVESIVVVHDLPRIKEEVLEEEMFGKVDAEHERSWESTKYRDGEMSPETNYFEIDRKLMSVGAHVEVTQERDKKINDIHWKLLEVKQQSKIDENSPSQNSKLHVEAICLEERQQNEKSSFKEQIFVQKTVEPDYAVVDKAKDKSESKTKNELETKEISINRPQGGTNEKNTDDDFLLRLEKNIKSLEHSESRKEKLRSIENLFTKETWETFEINREDYQIKPNKMNIDRQSTDSDLRQTSLENSTATFGSSTISGKDRSSSETNIDAITRTRFSTKRRLDMSDGDLVSQRRTRVPSVLDSVCGLDILQGLLGADMSMGGLGVCHRCGEGFGQHQQIVNSNGEVWHPQCFVCAQCFQPFPDGVFYEFEGRKYCEHDFNVLFAPCCNKCGDFIVGRVIKALNNSWHPDCFRCQLCVGPLADSGFVKNAGRALCRECNAKEKARAIGKYVCHKCHSIIEEGHIKYKGEAFHPYHFNCHSCSVELNADAREVNGELYCLRCHDKMGIPICGACRRPIEERVVHALGKAWHVEHFVCAKCEKPFFGTRHYEKKGLAYCEIHYHQLFGNICFTCNSVISGDVFHAFNKAWHVNHFGCSICDRKMSQKTKFFEFDLKPVCKFCYEKFPGELRKRLKKAYDEQNKK